ncbi:MAG: hypothetical protein ACP5JU_02640 [Minisyncoccia bacterium]
MIETLSFQFNLIGISITILLLTLLFFKKIDLISILALSSIFINFPIFNYKPWTFGFQIFFFFSIIFILSSIFNIFNSLKNKNFLILFSLVSLFILIVLIGLFLLYKNNYFLLVIKPKEDFKEGIFDINRFSRMNITQFLYLIFYFSLFLAIISSKFDLVKVIKAFFIGLNINFVFQIFEIFLYIFKKPLPIFLNDMSFSNETMQALFLKNFTIYRFSGLIPSSSMLGVYLTIAMFFILFFKVFDKDIYKKLQIMILIFSFLLSISSTFILGLLLILIYYLFKKKNYLIIFLIILLSILLFYTLSRETFIIRLNNLLFSINLFLKNPIFGIGWGSHFGDLFSNILVNTGILGTLSFLSIFIFLILKSLEEKVDYNLMMISLISLFLTGIIWNGININILWIILGIWGMELIKDKDA